MSEANWFYARQGQQVGPMTIEAVRGALAQGQMQGDDLVWREGMPDWVEAQTIAELMPARPARAVPPPLPQGVPLGVPMVGYYAPMQVTEDIGQNAGMRMLLPVGRSGWAIAAGYLGLFSFIVFPAPVALIISIIAIRDLRRHPELHGMGRAVFGLVMGSLGSIAILCIIGAAVLRR